MGSEIHYSLEDGIAVLNLARGGDNALVPQLRAELLEALERAMQDGQAHGAVLVSLGRVFSSGLDISEYDRELSPPLMSDLCLAIENATKPVVTSLHGAALGAGFELALASHARVAQTGTQVALPEVRLGMLPGGGGIQRLSRLVGAQAALKILLSGQAIAVDDPMVIHMFARIEKQDPLATAIQMARHLAQTGHWKRTCDVDRGFSDPVGYQAAIETLRKKLRPGDKVEADIVHCVEAAQLLSFDQALVQEGMLSEARRTSPSARGTRHVFAAERRARVMPDIGDLSQKEVNLVVVVAPGPGLAGLVVACLDRGQRVSVLAAHAHETADVVAEVTALYEGVVEQGRLDMLDRDARLRRLSQGCDLAVLADVDLVLDGAQMTIPETRISPFAAWCVLDEAQPSAARAAQIGRSTMALRVYRPAYIPRLAELATNEGSMPDSVARAVSYFSNHGATVLRTTEKPGLLGFRLIGRLYQAALVLCRVGADPFEIDEAAQDLGFFRGPFLSLIHI